MINNSTNSKLDEVVKTTLTEYEAPFDAGDWNRMESMLDAAPKQGSFKWSRSLTAAVVGIAVIGGSYFLYTSLNNPGTGVTTTPPPVIENKSIPAPAVTRPDPTPPAATNTVVATDEAVTAAPPAAEVLPPAKENVISKPVANEQKVKEEKITKEIVKAKKEKPVKGGISEEDREATQKIIGMGNEPIFGDMLDSSKGLIGETREREETKKAAKASKNVPVGWNSIMFPNLNTDSLRKYRTKRDSVKVQ